MIATHTKTFDFVIADIIFPSGLPVLMDSEELDAMFLTGTPSLPCCYETASVSKNCFNAFVNLKRHPLSFYL